MIIECPFTPLSKCQNVPMQEIDFFGRNNSFPLCKSVLMNTAVLGTLVGLIYSKISGNDTFGLLKSRFLTNCPNRTSLRESLLMFFEICNGKRDKKLDFKCILFS